MWLYRENHQEKAVTAESVRRELKPWEVEEANSQRGQELLNMEFEGSVLLEARTITWKPTEKTEKTQCVLQWKGECMN
jgi:hypothetical protein